MDTWMLQNSSAFSHDMYKACKTEAQENLTSFMLT